MQHCNGSKRINHLLLGVLLCIMTCGIFHLLYIMFLFKTRFGSTKIPWADSNLKPISCVHDDSHDQYTDVIGLDISTANAVSPDIINNFESHYYHQDIYTTD